MVGFPSLQKWATFVDGCASRHKRYDSVQYLQNIYLFHVKPDARTTQIQQNQLNLSPQVHIIQESSTTRVVESQSHAATWCVLPHFRDVESYSIPMMNHPPSVKTRSNQASSLLGVFAASRTSRENLDPLFHPIYRGCFSAYIQVFGKRSESESGRR
ncbi:uncharacterized protein EI90DRAFT_3050887 [Cantharellus anzutake]|uniref:uncharacterized protein n=1 Tax=Cantharellus anzutake TaxID=1750568 RepID=UPI00190799B4|nr:uncharacterized protein EI90DRAFT_3050887 [Cantharellus anzutake]KAF8334072.1 hypothetical protein EI90DRAFT_3050887 [Cantharellus anzutake]